VLVPGETVYVHLVEYRDDGSYPYELRIDFLGGPRPTSCP
jgi:hypothetical protein